MATQGFMKYLQRLRTPDRGPGSVAVEYSSIWVSYLYGIATPIIFIFLKAAKISLLPLDWAYQCLEWLSIIAPVLRQHVAVLTEKHLIIDIRNYPVFLIISFLMCCIPIVQACRIYFKKWRIMLSPHPISLLIIAMIFGEYYFMMVLQVDTAALKFRSMYQLYFDGAGIYYIRQFGLIFLYSVGVIFLILYLLYGIGLFVRKYIESRRYYIQK